MERYNSSTYKSHGTPQEFASLHQPDCVTLESHYVSLMITNSFSFIAVRMAMKRHRLQPECTEILDMMASQERWHRKGDYVQETREECRIVDGRLIQRRQVVIIPRRYWPSTRSLRTLLICPHVYFMITGSKGQSGLRRCQYCSTEYRIVFENYGGPEYAIVITRWKVLGTDWESEVWTEHLPPKEEPFFPFYMTKLPARIRSKLGKLSLDFEGSCKVKIDSLSIPEHRADLVEFQKKHWIEETSSTSRVAGKLYGKAVKLWMIV
jgi:hypothetical protein